MRGNKAMVLFLAAVVAVAARISFAVASPASTVPAFVWSSHLSDYGSKAVDYQIISPEDLVKSVLFRGGWSNFLCPGNELQHSVDLALVFVGSELRSSDITLDKPAVSSVVDFLKLAFTQSNFSLAFPYVSSFDEQRMERLLVSGFTEVCGQNLEVGNIAVSESCALEGGDFQKLSDLQAVHDHLSSKVEKKAKVKTDLVVVCQGVPHPSERLDQSQSEAEIMSEVISSVERSGVKYAALYVSDPARPKHHPSFRELERFLAEKGSGNVSGNFTVCDEVCQIKSSLLEGVFVLSESMILPLYPFIAQALTTQKFKIIFSGIASVFSLFNLCIWTYLSREL